jgi:hypothetical protein
LTPRPARLANATGRSVVAQAPRPKPFCHERHLVFWQDSRAGASIAFYDRHRRGERHDLCSPRQHTLPHLDGRGRRGRALCDR